MVPRPNIICSLALAIVILGSSNGRCQDEIPATQFEAIAWLEGVRNTVKRNAEGDVVEIVINYVPDVFVIGDLKIFPKLEVLEIKYTGQFQDRHMSGIANLQSLKVFAIDYCDEVSEATLSVLHYLPRLEELKLRHCDAIYSLEALANCGNLKKLDLSFNEHLDFKVLSSLWNFKPAVDSFGRKQWAGRWTVGFVGKDSHAHRSQSCAVFRDHG